MKRDYITLGAILDSVSSEDTIPSDLSGFDFVGYSPFGLREDSKGIMRLERTKNEPFQIIYIKTSPNESQEEIKVGRTKFEKKMKELEARIADVGQKGFDIISLDYYYTVLGESKLSKMKRQYQEMQRIEQQVAESLEDPMVYRETIGRITPSIEINGIEYTVDLAWTEEEIGSNPSMFLKGREMVVGDGTNQILAHRYFSDPRVVVDGAFEGDVRRPTNFNFELDEQTKVNLCALFKGLYREIEEVSFPKQERRSVK